MCIQSFQSEIVQPIHKNTLELSINIQNKKNRKDSEEYLGKTVKILCEDYDEKRNKYLGRDEYGRMAYFDGDKTLLGNFVDVKITKTGGISLLGEIVK